MRNVDMRFDYELREVGNFAKSLQQYKKEMKIADLRENINPAFQKKRVLGHIMDDRSLTDYEKDLIIDILKMEVN